MADRGTGEARLGVALFHVGCVPFDARGTRVVGAHVKEAGEPFAHGVVSGPDDGGSDTVGRCCAHVRGLTARPAGGSGWIPSEPGTGRRGVGPTPGARRAASKRPAPIPMPERPNAVSVRIAEARQSLPAPYLIVADGGSDAEWPVRELVRRSPSGRRGRAGGRSIDGPGGLIGLGHAAAVGW
jgi:hypothetical protein